MQVRVVRIQLSERIGATARRAVAILREIVSVVGGEARTVAQVGEVFERFGREDARQQGKDEDVAAEGLGEGEAQHFADGLAGEGDAAEGEHAGGEGE